MRFSWRALLVAASAVYAPGVLLAQAPGRQVPAAAVTPTAPAWVSFRSPKFEIPFSVDSIGTRPIEVQLLVSRDGGARWEMCARQSAGGHQFPFSATADGDYWFATRTIDATGAAHPPGPVTPQLRVTVDTANPQIAAQADADGSGQIVVDFRITDAAPVAEDIRLEYMTDTVRQWMPVQFASQPVLRQQPGFLEGRIVWTPQTDWRYVQLRMIARDRAGNQAVVTREVEKPRVAAQVPAQLASTPLTPPPAYPPAATAYPPPAATTYAPPAAPMAAKRRGFTAAAAPSPGDRWASIHGHTGPAPADPGLDLNAPAAAANPRPAVAGRPAADQPAADRLAADQLAADRTAAAAMRPLPVEELPAPLPTPIPAAAAPPQTLPPQALPPIAQPPHAGGAATGGQQTLTARTSDGSAASVAPPSTAAPILSRRLIADLAGVRQTNSHRFSLDYEVESVGTQGLSAIELWATKDQGQSWEPWGEDPDGESPFDIETAGQGVYGFKMVVVGGNGLTSPRPMPGDPADLYVLVDTQTPTVRITGARYGDQQETGQLIISYRCDDANANLVDRPVTLSFAETPAGPWTTIATGLANDGRYAWPADPQLPRQIYLRVEAVDQAGNVGAYTLDTPVDVQGLAPRARIRGFNPIAEQTPSAPRARFQ